MFDRLEDEDISFVTHIYQSARIRLNLTIGDVAKELGGSERKWRRKVRDLERGHRLEAMEDYLQIGEVLEIDLEELGQTLAQRREERRRVAPLDTPPQILGVLLEQKRVELDLSHREILETLGWSLSERRLRSLLVGRHRFPSDAELETLSGVLDLELDVLKSARSAEYAYYDESEVPPQLIVRAMAAIYGRAPLPEEADTASQIEYAEAFSAEHKRNVCLVFGDGRSLYIYPDGSRSERFEAPSMRIR